MYLIAASPYAKIFQAQYHGQLMKNPELIKKILPGETIVVFRPSGNINFELGKAKLIGGPEGSDKNQDVIELRNWLCGGKSGNECQETECYGIVDLNIESDVMTSIAQIVAGAALGITETKTKGGDLQKELITRMKEAAKLAEHRVMRAVRRVWANFEAQQRANKENGLGPVEPSPVEYLCAYALRDEIRASKEERERVVSEYRNMNSDIQRNQEGL